MGRFFGLIHWVLHCKDDVDGYYAFEFETEFAKFAKNERSAGDLPPRLAVAGLFPCHAHDTVGADENAYGIGKNDRLAAREGEFILIFLNVDRYAVYLKIVEGDEIDCPRTVDSAEFDWSLKRDARERIVDDFQIAKVYLGGRNV